MLFRSKSFGPTKAAAQLEGSKGFTKDICKAHNIPTAAYERFNNATAAKAYVQKQGAPIVIKADGLAAGKGVVVAMTMDEALAAVDMMFGGGLGDAGAEVVVEELLQGEEASFFVLSDGENALPLASAQDHKRVFDGDKGPNTGGMGAYSPVAIMTPAMEKRALDEIVLPTIRALKAMGTPYKGVLFAGLMITKDGPKLIEYNARFGDPETQVLMLRMQSDILPALIASCDGQLKSFNVRWFDEAALTVVMAAKGYPGNYGRGSEIKNLDAAGKTEGVEIFHAGTSRTDGRILANAAIATLDPRDVARLGLRVGGHSPEAVGVVEHPVVAALDLVITVDNTVAHLAGALGCPVWTLLPAAPEWRYPRNGARMPWYSSMWLLHRSFEEDAAAIMGRVASGLAQRIESRTFA